ncbi:hypothetical protein COCNU_contig69214386G000010 [Cocos nucifera]|nr:hypothetical protein [Cocos nucifera]
MAEFKAAYTEAEATKAARQLDEKQRAIEEKALKWMKATPSFSLPDGHFAAFYVKELGAIIEDAIAPTWDSTPQAKD